MMSTPKRLSAQQRILRLEGLSYSGLERRVSAAGGKRAAAARGLLLAAHRSADQILDSIGGCVVPFFSERAAARPTGKRSGRIRDGFLGVAHQHGRRRVCEIP